MSNNNYVFCIQMENCSPLLDRILAGTSGSLPCLVNTNVHFFTFTFISVNNSTVVADYATLPVQMGYVVIGSALWLFYRHSSFYYNHRFYHCSNRYRSINVFTAAELRTYLLVTKQYVDYYFYLKIKPSCNLGLSATHRRFD